jgi:ATP-dependent RNA helicase RhlE
MNTTESVESFSNLGIAPKLLEILEKNKFTKPTPIQAQSIPAACEGKDLMGIAQTGTGKTLAFGIPMIQRLAQSQGQKKGLVILPTRELAMQVDETLKKIGSSLGLKTALLIGGESMFRQLKATKQNPHIIIATPGRLNDHLQNNGLNLSKVGILVLDEADRMLDMGFAPQIKRILEKIPADRQTMLFSATMPDEIVKIAQTYMHLPLRVEVAPAGSAVKTVTQELFFVDRNEKLSLLKNILAKYTGSILVFTRTKHAARKIARDIRTMGYTANEIHSNRSLHQRIEALEGFKIGRYRVLVATDIAARGIDVSGIQLVINYDLPATAEDYVHRIGRTGRAGMAGHAISFATSDQRGDVRSIERLIRTTLAVSKSPELPRGPRTDFSTRPHTPTQPQTTTPQRREFPHAGTGRGSSKYNRNSKYRNSKPSTGSSRNQIRTLSRKPAEGEGYFMSPYKNRSDE